MHTLIAYWKNRSPREQRLLQLMISVVFAAALIQLTAIALSQRESLSRQIQTYRREYAQLQALANTRPIAESGATNRLQGEALLVHLRAQPESSALQLTVSGQDKLAGQGQMAFDTWILWLARLQKSQGLYPLQAEIQRGDREGMVKLNFELGRPQ